MNKPNNQKLKRAKSRNYTLPSKRSVVAERSLTKMREISRKLKTTSFSLSQVAKVFRVTKKQVSLIVKKFIENSEVIHEEMKRPKLDVVDWMSIKASVEHTRTTKGYIAPHISTSKKVTISIS